jgi:hypothetical protein
MIQTAPRIRPVFIRGDIHDTNSLAYTPGCIRGIIQSMNSSAYTSMVYGTINDTNNPEDMPWGVYVGEFIALGALRDLLYLELLMYAETR